MSGSRRIEAPREIVWAALNDAEYLKGCIPGCSALARTSDERFDLTVGVRLGSVHVAFKGTVDILDCVPPRAYALRGMGQGPWGRAFGTTRISLTDMRGGCRLAYTVDVEAQGVLAALGQLILAGLGKTMTEQFVWSLADRLRDRQAAPLPAAWSSSTMSSSV